MPGWYLHVDIARKAIDLLDGTTGTLDTDAGTLLGAGGPTAAELAQIAKENPAYFSLGAIGPDIFFLLPDFAPPFGTPLYGAAHTVKTIYTELDDLVIGPLTDQFSAISHNSNDILDAASGGLIKELSTTAGLAMNIMKDAVLIVGAMNFDWFGLLGSGVPRASDEQAFYWSDMLHYRKTYEFAAELWARAVGPLPNSPTGAICPPEMTGTNEQQKFKRQFQAFTLGWMTHLAADVTGHCFVNEKSGGPYRLLWQRHHLVENHMDARGYIRDDGSNVTNTQGEPNYEEFSAAAMHLWLAFDAHNDPPSSYASVFDSNDQHRPPYLTGDNKDTASFLDRQTKWDVDSDMPEELAQFLVDTLKAVYTDPGDPCTGNWAAHPTIMTSIRDGNGNPVSTDGFPSACDITTTYWWLYHYVKASTTDLYRFARPKPPTVFNFAPFPTAPKPLATPTPASQQSGNLAGISDALHLIMHIFALLDFWAQILVWGLANAINLITGPLTYGLRQWVYDYVEIPLYNSFMLLHWYLSILGFVHPLKQEISPALDTMGIGFPDVWIRVEIDLLDPLGGLKNLLDDLGELKSAPLTGTEPSGSGDTKYPHDAVTDPQTAMPTPLFNKLIRLIPGLTKLHCGEWPSEFLRPWHWPSSDVQNNPIGSELPFSAPAGPYGAGADATALLSTNTMGGTIGNTSVRTALEGAFDEADTQSIVASLPPGQTLGDPAQYAAYVIAKLTRDDTLSSPIANFNLDADRGYGYLCWDWVRSHATQAFPASFAKECDPRTYQAPLRPGYGWCESDLKRKGKAPSNCPTPTPTPTPVTPCPTPTPAVNPQTDIPTMHRPELGTVNDPVRVRYIDREYK